MKIRQKVKHSPPEDGQQVLHAVHALTVRTDTRRRHAISSPGPCHCAAKAVDGTQRGVALEHEVAHLQNT